MPFFSDTECGRIAAMIAESEKDRITPTIVDDYISVLKKHKQSLKAQDIKALTPEDLEQYRMKRVFNKKR